MGAVRDPDQHHRRRPHHFLYTTHGDCFWVLYQIFIKSAYNICYSHQANHF